MEDWEKEMRVLVAYDIADSAHRVVECAANDLKRYHLVGPNEKVAEHPFFVTYDFFDTVTLEYALKSTERSLGKGAFPDMWLFNTYGLRESDRKALVAALIANSPKYCRTDGKLAPACLVKWPGAEIEVKDDVWNLLERDYGLFDPKIIMLDPAARLGTVARGNEISSTVRNYLAAGKRLVIKQSGVDRQPTSIYSPQVEGTTIVPPTSYPKGRTSGFIPKVSPQNGLPHNGSAQSHETPKNDNGKRMPGRLGFE